MALVVGLDEVVEDHQEEEQDADDVGKHGQLDVWDHLGTVMFVASLKVEQVSVNSIFGKTGGVNGGEQLQSSKHDNIAFH